MEKEPLTIQGLENLKKELIFLKEKKDQKLFQQLLKLDLMEI